MMMTGILRKWEAVSTAKGRSIRKDYPPSIAAIRLLSVKSATHAPVIYLVKKGKKIMKVFVECKKCGFEVVPNEDGTCYNCSEPMEANE